MNEEEKKAIEYYQNKEVCFSVDFDTEKLLRALGITEEDSFENHQIRFKTLLNLIEKIQKENEKLKNKLLDTLEGQKVIKEETPRYIKENYIPIQKVKDKIEKEIKYHERNILEIENITMLKSKTAKEEAEIEFNKYAIVVLKKILQELIKEEEENHEENI